MSGGGDALLDHGGMIPLAPQQMPAPVGDDRLVDPDCIRTVADLESALLGVETALEGLDDKVRKWTWVCNQKGHCIMSPTPHY